MAAKWKPRPIVVPDVPPMINTTPLIDLMLVLLVMLIISMPVANHRMPLKLPPPDPGMRTPPPSHRLDVDAAGRLSWDGQPIAEAELGPRLARMAADPAQPLLNFAAAAETRYERVDEALALVLRARITRLGFVGNEDFLRRLDQPG